MTKNARGKELVASRPATHGLFEDVAKTIDALKAAVMPGFLGLNVTQQAAMGEIFHKVARIAVGDPNHVDHWDDIGGYAELGSRACTPATEGGKRAKAGPTTVKKASAVRPKKTAKKKAVRARVSRPKKKAKTSNRRAVSVGRSRQNQTRAQRRQAAPRPASSAPVPMNTGT